MPRPKGGYVNSAGLPIPGTHDPISRFMDQTALKFWAWKQGKAGISLFERNALDIGTCVHTMIELDIQGQPEKDILFYARQTLKIADDLDKANVAFKAWRAWSAQHHLRPHVQEVSLVSEKHQYGGTPDLIAYVDDALALLDFKTSAKGDVYPDKLVAMAAHGKLWTENNPTMPLTGGYHLIMLPKDGSGFRHYAYADLHQHWKLFKLYLKAYRLDKECSDAKVLAGGRIGAPPSTARRAPTTRKVAEKTVAPMNGTITMGELLRAYGHVEGAAA